MKRTYLYLALPLILIALAAIAIPVTDLSGTHVSAQSASKTYVVAFHQPNGLPAKVDDMVAKSGGTIIARMPEIGGIAVSSSNENFVAAMNAYSSVKAADVATEMKLINPPADGPSTQSADNNGGNFSPAGADPQTGTEPLYNQQWDKMRMNASSTGSYAVERGRSDVTVAILDTGTDPTHPDITQNFDASRSVSFVPAEPTIQDFNGHGTWCMSAVAAPINAVGISGVAPDVTVVSLKVLNAAGSGAFFWLAQALVYSGLQHFDVASMSLGGYIPRCGQNDPTRCDHPDFILLQRSVQFARENGVLPIAALGNDNFDVSDGRFFAYFVEAPGEIAGVVGVSATGYYNQKAHYSNYGMGKTDIAAPGGATRNYTGVPGSGAPPPPYNGIGRVLGAWSATGSPLPNDPDIRTEQCTGPGNTPPCYPYAYIQGTSMACPNAAGVAALIVSHYGDFTPSNKNKPHMSPTHVETILQTTANNQPCPSPRTVIAGPGFVLPTATCSGETGYNNFFGKGIVDALKAVSLQD